MIEEKFIYIVLSRSGTILSRIIHLVTRDRFTHASIALDEDLYRMFSFGRRYTHNPFIGCFKQELLSDRHFVRGRAGMIIKLPVTQEQYNEVSLHIQDFRDYSEAFFYNVRGLVTSAFHRTAEGYYRFFCSEFVYHVLNSAGVCDFGVTRGHVRPMTFIQLNGTVVYEGMLPQYAMERGALTAVR